MTPIKLVILGDVRLYREGLAQQFAGVPGVEVVGVAPLAEAEGAVCAADVALADALGADIAPAVASLRKTRDKLRIVAVGVRETETEILACAAAGVDGFVRTDATLAEAAAEIESVMRGELVCSPRVAASLYRNLASAGAGDVAAMTGREIQVAELIEQGLSNKEIAQSLGIEPATAKNHVQSILQKLAVHRRGQAVAKLRAERATRLTGQSVPP